MLSQRTLIVTSILLLLLMVGGAFAAVPFVLLISWSLALILLAAVVGAWVFQVRDKAADPYDLNELQRVHDQAEIADLEVAGVGEIDPDAEILCPHCGSVARARYRACPSCGGLI